jgi:hypothetical protein
VRSAQISARNQADGHEHGRERGAEAAAAGVEVHQPLLNHLIRPRQQ